MLVKEVPSPWFLLRVLILKVPNCSLWIVTLHNEAFIASSDVIMERILESQCVELVGALDLEDNGSNDGIEFGPAHWYHSSCVEKAWPNDVFGEVFLETSLLDVPSNNLNILGGHFVSDFNNMEAIVVIVVAL